jgi:hypothetical protein
MCGGIYSLTISTIVDVRPDSAHAPAITVTSVSSSGALRLSLDVCLKRSGEIVYLKAECPAVQP